MGFGVGGCSSDGRSQVGSASSRQQNAGRDGHRPVALADGHGPDLRGGRRDRRRSLATDVRTSDVPRTESFDEMMRRYFAGGWQSRDIRAERGVPLLMRGTRVFIDEDIFTREELERSQYINECTLPVGFKWAAGIGFMAGSAMWGLCLHRTFKQAPFEASDVSALQTLPGRLSEVATLSAAVGRVALSSAADALDLVGRPAIALDRIRLGPWGQSGR